MLNRVDILYSQIIQLMVFGVLGVHGAHAAVSAPCLESDPVTTHLLSMGAKSALETQQVILKNLR